MAIESKHISTGLAAFGVLALAATGYVNITTPEAQQCEVDLADKKARLEIGVETLSVCKEALEQCSKAISVGDEE
jgi:hypothetical protein